MRKLLKKLRVAALFVTMTFGFATTANADLGSAFEGLLGGASVATQEGGYYESQARTGVVFGGARVRWENSTVQLFNVTPPRISAGCNGIDFFLGGFSFINGEQFTQLMRNIGQAALGYVVQLALKQLCPQCEAVISALQKAAQLARKAAVDSCEAGTALGAYIGEQIGLTGGANSEQIEELQNKECGKWANDANKSDSFINAVNSLCSTADKAMEQFSDFVKQDPKRSGELSTVFGNSTWEALKELGVVKHQGAFSAELIMSMTGTMINIENGDSNGYKPPTIKDPQVALDMFLCGVGGAAGKNPVAQQYCEKVKVPTSFNVYQCDETTYCHNLSAPTIGEWQAGKSVLGDEGFIVLVSDILNKAVDNTAKGQRLDPEALSLINTMPFPLFKAINIAAVYPSVSKQLIESNTMLVSYVLADTYLRHIMSEAMKYPPTETGQMDPAVVKHLIDVTTKMNEGTAEIMKQIDNLTVRQQRLMAQINQINNVMQNQIFSKGLAGNSSFASNLSSQVAGRQ